MSVVYKLFINVLTIRISVTLDSNQRKEQTGFMSGYSTNDHIHVIDQVALSRHAWLSLTIKKTLGSMVSEQVIKVLRKQSIEEVYVKLLEDTYKGSTATINLLMVSNKSPVKKRIRQYPISAAHFTISHIISYK